MTFQITLQEPFRALFYAPFYAALARGDYAAQGVEVRLLPGAAPSLAKDSVLDGTADLAWGGPMRLLLAHDKDHGCPLRLFGAVVMGDPFFLVGRQARPDFRLADLATLTLGTVSEVPTPWWTLQDDIRRAGLDPGSLARVTDRSMAENAAAVAAGTLDVAQVFEPIASAMEIAGTGHAWYAQASRGPTSYTAFYGRTDVIAAKRPAFEAMVRGLAVTLAWFAKALPADILAAIAPFFDGLDQSAAAKAVARYRDLGVWTTTPRFPPEALARLEAAMLSARAITHAPGFAGLVAEDVTDAALA
ncbi:ABC transporter substrate-binding protein [Roseomonas sp. CAU 1739]|uniref:ABC transporter substrate-binding protein n=1 Tax=Roseomonas sp. CAU 1739 TaxID=3140364 RepID=UPI00325BCE8B